MWNFDNTSNKKKNGSSISALTITAGGMQNKRAIIEVYAYTFVLSIPVCKKESLSQTNTRRKW